jgi:hypothetical protein
MDNLYKKHRKRKKPDDTFQTEISKEEVQKAQVNIELKKLIRDEEAHLEMEFEDYDKIYSCESNK